MMATPLVDCAFPLLPKLLMSTADKRTYCSHCQAANFKQNCSFANHSSTLFCFPTEMRCWSIYNSFWYPNHSDMRSSKMLVMYCLFTPQQTLLIIELSYDHIDVSQQAKWAIESLPWGESNHLGFVIPTIGILTFSIDIPLIDSVHFSIFNSSKPQCVWLLRHHCFTCHVFWFYFSWKGVM